MFTGQSRRRLTVIALLAAAVLGVGGSRFVYSQMPPDIKIIPVTPPDDKGSGPAADDKKDEDTAAEKKDPTDIRNSIGSIDLIRGLNKLKKPPEKKPDWEEIVNLSPAPEWRAQKLLFHGQYADAEAKYRELLKKDAKEQDFIEGLMESIFQQGHQSDIKRFDEKLSELTEPQRSTPRMIRLRAEALRFSGKNAEAMKLLKAFSDAHQKVDPNDGEVVAVINCFGRLLEEQAEYGAATGIYTRLVESISGEWPEDPKAATELTFAVYRRGVLSGSSKSVNNSVLAQIGRIRQSHQAYWPAFLIETQLLLAGHDEKNAGAAMAEVMKWNPNDLSARFLSVDHAISSYNFEGARAQLDELKQKTDGAMVDAYEGRLLLKERLPNQAVSPLVSAIKKNPNLIEARGWLAGTYYLLGFDEKRMNEQLEAVKAPTPSSMHPVALFETAEVLRDARQFVMAEKLYVKAEEAAKWWVEPPTGLAALFLETGNEKKAKAKYEEVFKSDPYNMKIINQLKLLDIMEGFERIESKTRLGPNSELPAFIIYYDKQDEVLAKLALDWMEKIRPEVWSYFQVKELQAPTQIEFFPSHEEFGVRTTGLPWIGTVGASTGHVIAMDVPRGGKKTLMGPFDWARVLRHEYTHTVTLAMTNNRIPHWLTEACACAQEQAPRDWNNCQLLWMNYRTGDLFKVANLNWGFIKPKKSTDRQLAYMQSQWLYEYLVEAYGQPKMIDFLHAFRDGATEPEAWQKVYNKTMDQIDKDFHEWAGKQLATWGLPVDPMPPRKTLEDALKANPKDVEALVNLARLEAMSPREQSSARKHLEEAIAIDAKHLRARELLGGILANSAKKEDLEKAKTLLEEVVKEDAKRSTATRMLGVMAMNRQDFVEAEKYFKQLQVLLPQDVTSYTNLAGIYLVKKDYASATGQLLELQNHEQHDERIPRKLAMLYKEQGKLAEAEQSAYRAIRINPYNAVNHEVLAQVIVAQKDTKRSIEYWAAATTLQPKVAQFWEGLAEAKGTSGDAAGAAEAAKKAVDLQPSSPAKKWVKE